MREFTSSSGKGEYNNLPADKQESTIKRTVQRLADIKNDLMHEIAALQEVLSPVLIPQPAEAISSGNLGTSRSSSPMGDSLVTFCEQFEEQVRALRTMRSQLDL